MNPFAKTSNDQSLPSPSEFDLGSPESRAAARLMAERRREQGSCQCSYIFGRLGDDVMMPQPFTRCEFHRADPLSEAEVARDILRISEELRGNPLKDGLIMACGRPI